MSVDVAQAAHPETSGLSRRRILQGVAWATPAILIATAAPAFAAGSGEVVQVGISAGAMAVTGLSASKTFSYSEGGRSITASGALAYGTPGKAPVTGVAIRFEFDAALVSSQTPTVVEGASSWTLAGSGIDATSGRRYFKYSYNLGTLSDASSVTPSLKITVAAVGALDFGTTVYAGGTGRSADTDVAVNPLTTVALAIAKGSLLLDANTQSQPSFWVANLNQNVNAKVVNFHVQYKPNAGGGTVSPLTSLTMTLTITKAVNASLWGAANALGTTNPWPVKAGTTPTMSGDTLTVTLDYSNAPVASEGEAALYGFWSQVTSSASKVTVLATGVDQAGRTLTASYGPA